ncbi:hypothetical protein MCW_01307 [Cardidatus Bartonella washoeensis 085-0475]|uniref:Uncharacterized protein n=1 Tax=Cardidatus Bartonella washoeensis 085-0475 TaxID=1094564 RepID=J1JHC9_9HYPH|nr:hypothetical protein MCW_01307 [Bartonella washoeensis 085-0475]
MLGILNARIFMRKDFNSSCLLQFIYFSERAGLFFNNAWSKCLDGGIGVLKTNFEIKVETFLPPFTISSAYSTFMQANDHGYLDHGYLNESIFVLLALFLWGMRFIEI